MINWLHSLFHRPGAGWDPVPADYARSYAAREWAKVDSVLLDWLGEQLGGWAGKRVLDLGGGPGQYSIALARRGAQVTWHDISRSYLDIVSRKAVAAGVSLDTSLGYLEEARKFQRRPFDLVFCRICWYYCMNDQRFAGLFYRLVTPGGCGYIDANSAEQFPREGWPRLQAWINGRLGWKIGHPHPPRGRIRSLFQDWPLDEIKALDGPNERVFFRRPVDANQRPSGRF